MKKVTKVGKHTVMHSDIMKSDIKKLLKGKKVDMMYSDPPWGAGNLRYWQTINKRQTGDSPNDVNLVLFLHKIFDIATNHVKGVVFMEYGIKWRDDIKALIKEYKLKDIATIPLQYKSGSNLLPLDLHVFSKTKQELPQAYIDSVANTHGYNTLTKVFSLYPDMKGVTILDPCCGMGYTAQIAVDRGMTFYGNELNSKRLEQTIKRLERDVTN